MALTLFAQTATGKIAVIIVMQEHNLQRMKQHDPMEIPMGISDLQHASIESVTIAYTTDEEMALYEVLARQGRQKEMVELIYRGFQSKPEDGEAVERLNPELN